MTDTELTYAFKEKALKEQHEMYASLFNICKMAYLKDLESALEKYWPDYFSGNQLIYGAPLIAHLLHHMGTYFDNYRRQPEKCIELLVNKCGASLNQPDERGQLPLDNIISGSNTEYKSDEYKRYTYDAVKFVLTHGGIALKKREKVIRFLELRGVMTRKEFEEFEATGHGCGPKDTEKEATMAANHVLVEQIKKRRELRQELLSVNRTIKSGNYSVREADGLKKKAQELQTQLTTTTPERKKKLEEIRAAYYHKPAYLSKPLETQEERSDRTFSIELSEKLRESKRPYRGGVVLPKQRPVVIR